MPIRSLNQAGYEGWLAGAGVLVIQVREPRRLFFNLSIDQGLKALVGLLDGARGSRVTSF
jgi:hypothetical protein